MPSAAPPVVPGASNGSGFFAVATRIAGPPLRRTAHPARLPSGGGSTILGRNFCSRTCQIGALDKLASEHYLLLMNVQTQPKTQIIAARIPAELHRDAKAAVAFEGTTLQDKVIALLQRWLDERKAALAILASVQPREPRP